MIAVLLCNHAQCEQPPDNCGVEAINGYAKGIDASLKKMQVRHFAESESGGKSEWVEIKGRSDAYTVASVYMNDAKLPVAAFFTIQTESADWVLFVGYYFRTDGSLAGKHERLNTFYGNATVLRSAFFGCRGELLRTTSQHLDLKTQKPKTPDPDFEDEESPTFKRVGDLPFISLLKRSRK